MLGVEADSESLAFFGCVEHPGDLLEAVAEIGTLASSDLRVTLTCSRGMLGAPRPVNERWS